MTPLSFDDYSTAVRQAVLSFVLTQPEEDNWWLEYVAGQTTTVQFGSDGGASIADGIAMEGAYILIGRHFPSAADISINGEVIGPEDFVLLPPGARFIFSANRSRSWLSVSLPRELVEAIWLSNSKIKSRLLDRRPLLVAVSASDRREFVERAEHTRSCHIKGDSELAQQDAEARLLDISRSILSNDRVVDRAGLDSQGLKALDAVSRALLSLHSGQFGDHWYVDDLASAAEVQPRTLLRSFHRVVGMGPVRYLRFRQLNAIRRQLLSVTNDAMTVTQIMQSNGSSDMGRASGAYKALFGESPSETMRQAPSRANGSKSPRGGSPA